MNYSLRHGNDVQVPKVRTTSFGIETIAYLGSRLWHLLPQEIKQSNTLPIFKNQLNVGKLVNATATLQKIYSASWVPNRIVVFIL